MRTDSTTASGSAGPRPIAPAPLDARGTLRLTGAGLSLIAVCYGLARFAYGLFLPAFRRDFALEASTAGLLASGSYAAYCLAILLSTVLTPRIGGRALAVIAGAVATAGTLLIAAAPTTAVLALGVLLAGSSTGAASPPLAHTVARSVAPAARSRVQAVINAGTGLGVAMAGPVALLTLESWRLAWLVFAIACAAVTLWVARAVPSDTTPDTGPGGRGPSPAEQAAAPRGRGRAARAPLPHGTARLVTAAALLGISSTAVWTFGRSVLMSTAGMSEVASTIAWIVLGAFGALGAAAGDLAERLGLRAAWASGMAVLAVATAAFVLPSPVAVTLIAAAAFGASYIGLTGVLLLWGTGIHTERPAIGVGIAFLVIALGQAAGSPVIGALTERSGATAAFCAAALTALVGAAVRPGKVEGSAADERTLRRLSGRLPRAPRR